MPLLPRLSSVQHELQNVSETLMAKDSTHYLSSGKVYKGAVHKSKGVLMTGAKHTERSKKLTHTPPRKVKK